MSHYRRKTLPAEMARYQHWPEADLTTLDGAARSRFAEIREAIIAYLNGERMKERLAAIKLSHPELLRRLNRCVSYDESGRLIGWPALFPAARLKPYCRVAPPIAREPMAHGGYSGALGHVLGKYPSLYDRLYTYIVSGSRDGGISESRVTAKDAHQYFLALCQEFGLSDSEWPFCVVGMGDRAFQRWYQKFVKVNYDLIVLRQFGKDAATKAATGQGVRSRLQARLPYDIVEMDEHTIDVLGSIGIPTAKGFRYLAIKRLVLILVVDRFTQAALGYQVIVRRKVKAMDVIATVARSVTPWQPRRMVLPGFEVPADSGFPSERIPELANCGFGMLLMDNDSAHLAESVLSRIGFMAGCAINYGRVGRPERRPIVESLNKRLEATGFHRLPSTTGAGPKDSRRRDAEAKAVQHKVKLDALLDLIEAVIADHNASRPAGNQGRTPLELLRQYVADDVFGFLPPSLPPRLPGMPSLGLAIERLSVGGSLSRGDRAHIMLDRARYEAPWLSARTDLVGRDVIAHVDEDEVSSFKVYSLDGSSLGTVQAAGVWADHPHSRETRRLINAAIKEGYFTLRKGRSVVADWLALLAKDALANAGTIRRPKTSKAANQLAEEARLGNVDLSRDLGQVANSAVNGNTLPLVNAPDTKPSESACPTKTIASIVEMHGILPVDAFFAINRG